MVYHHDRTSRFNRLYQWWTESSKKKQEILEFKILWIKWSIHFDCFNKLITKNIYSRKNIEYATLQMNNTKYTLSTIPQSAPFEDQLTPKTQHYYWWLDRIMTHNIPIVWYVSIMLQIVEIIFKNNSARIMRTDHTRFDKSGHTTITKTFTAPETK